MRIAIDARIIYTSTGRYIERLLHYLQQIDHKNEYLVLLRRKDIGKWQPSAKNFTAVEAEFADYSFAEQLGYKKLLDTLHPDLVHFCMPQQPLGYKGKKVTTVHDLTLLKTYNSDKNWLKYHFKQLVGRYVFKRIARDNDHVIVPTQFTYDEYVAYTKIPKDKITLSYEAADVEIDKLQRYKHPFKQFIMYVGSESDYKNIRRLGDAHQKLLETHPDLGLILVGRKNQAALNVEKYFTDRDYKNILYTDFIPDSQRDWLYTHCAAYVFPSTMEGFGLPGLEAMGYGAPVVSSNATCLPEVYEDAAHYFDPFDVDDMARAISEVIDDKKLQKALIKKGYRQFKKYSWKRMAKETHRVYMNALRSK